MLYLTTDEIRVYHTEILKRTLEVIKKKKGYLTEEHRHQNTLGEFEGKLDSIMFFFLNPTDNNYSVYARISQFMYKVCIYHPFIEGNKRTAYFISVILFDLNGCELKASRDEVFSILIDVSEGKINEMELEKWLRKKCKIKFLSALFVTGFQIIYFIGRGIRDIEWSRITDAEHILIKRTQFFVDYIES